MTALVIKSRKSAMTRSCELCYGESMTWRNARKTILICGHPVAEVCVKHAKWWEETWTDLAAKLPGETQTTSAAKTLTAANRSETPRTTMPPSLPGPTHGGHPRD